MHVEVGFYYASGEEFVDEYSSEQMVIRYFRVDGYEIPAELAQLSNFGLFLHLSLRLDLPLEETSPYMLRGLSQILELKDEIGREWVDEVSHNGRTTKMTTEAVMVLPVSSLEFVQLETSV